MSTNSKEEEAVQLPGTPGCNSCHYLMVQTRNTFRKAQSICRKCYRGNLVSTHNRLFDNWISCWARRINQAKLWLGVIIKLWCLWKKYCWIDGSSWNFTNWARWQPTFGNGHCIALSTTGGRWRRAPCKRRLPFICSY
ncbi:proteoglycan 3-like [Muntiacus reevesi]|uniref:proteoglycan 3-like n=1 Tax=Muntiacus reevesi TaxID=9886 RepID=UPI003306DDEB